MKEYIIEFLRDYENRDEISKRELDNLYKVIQFTEHERLVHLIITIVTAFVWLLFLTLYLLWLPFIVPAIVMTVVLICYIQYYCWMENTVQDMYKKYTKFSKTVGLQ